MFSLSELVPLNQHQSRSKLLKPWWEVFMDYLVVLMLMASVLACTEQLSRDRVVCIPLDPVFTVNTSHQSPGPGGDEALTPPSKPPTHSPHNISPDVPPSRGRKTHLVYQQYIYISQVCYHEALPVCSRFFPYMALLQTLVLVASGSFWLHFPHTSARIEHFLAILAKCCESPWTSQALSHAAQQENLPDERGPLRRAPSLSSTPVIYRRQPSTDSGTESPLLKRSDSGSSAAPPSPCPSNLSCNSIMSSTSHSSQVNSVKPSVMDSPRQVLSLDKSDGEQARALFERVRKFRSHCEISDVIYKVYSAQTIFKLLMVTLIVGYTIPLLGSFSFTHTCRPEETALVGYDTFECIHVISSLMRKLLVAYLTLLGLYGLLNVYTLSWILHSSLRQYSFHSLKDLCSLRDVPDLRNDLAFLLHMLDQYDPLLAQRLSVFLSPVSESRLMEESLERRWGEEKLRAMISVDADGCSRLQLVALPRLPPALFTLSQLQVLKLELIADARFTAQVANMAALRELHLYHCMAAVDPSALGVLKERLEVLHLTFTQASEIPSWVLSLRSLHELHLCGRLSSDGGVGRSWSLGSLRLLRHLRLLVIRGRLQRIPGELCEVAGSLVRLEIHNEGTRLLVLTGLKRMVDLTELLLQDCQLERLPSALLALTNLRTLDLQHNNLRTLEELLTLAHLRRLSSLRLAYNRVLVLPNSVGVLRGLELLDLSNNQLRGLPPALFSLRHLRRLLLAGNLLEELPAAVKALQLLTELDLSGNRLENLPSELFRNCLELRTLNVARNSLSSLPSGIAALSHLSRLDLRSNSLEELPAELGCCSGLHGGGLLVEEWLFLSLPPQVRDFLSHSFTFTGKRSEDHTRPESDSFPYFSPTLWSFSSALESQI
ncbi:volume-regulated anion channel subunit LRRC8D [Notolabrus celidotus]|uniref:volume-regulated anion channel subunit LRRC8D n=1 Tax=Notolabrus celidotus TaxID=1203425 RepID=UPI0014907879|nr:volume-regulated anion channel subunit LRRC8D [Notolabrus celidotus]XP_034568124.1 volume-regulated anion channel subunit LRRC8D [Notolabrus celidotus]XP_034568125.1 volume-regulated anion channel subunit LRRC8D [Notolabrus celidotus]